MRHRGFRVAGIGLVAVVALGFLIPQRLRMPVVNATPQDWNARSYWFSPWGKSGVHKGIDIFAAEGRTVVSASDGIVLFRGHWQRGGEVVLVLGPLWRLHYYAHLRAGLPPPPRFVSAGTAIGAVGRTGNAAGKPAHLHYSVLSLIPIPWQFSGTAVRGWQRMFFIDPGAMLLDRGR